MSFLLDKMLGPHESEVLAGLDYSTDHKPNGLLIPNIAEIPEKEFGQQSAANEQNRSTDGTDLL